MSVDMNNPFTKYEEMFNNLCETDNGFSGYMK